LLRKGDAKVLLLIVDEGQYIDCSDCCYQVSRMYAPTSSNKLPAFFHFDSLEFDWAPDQLTISDVEDFSPCCRTKVCHLTITGAVPRRYKLVSVVVG
jgi:hypothetical protein